MMQTADVFEGASSGIVWRRSLVEFALASSSPMLLLAAPAGYGKSLLAGQIASHFRTQCRADFEGRPYAPEAILAELSGCLGTDSSVARSEFRGSLAASVSTILAGSGGCGQGACVTVDGFDETTLGDAVDELWSLAQILVEFRSRLVVCVRCVDLPNWKVLRRIELLGPDELRFSLAEAQALRGPQVDGHASDSEVRQLWEACDGHPALLALLARDLDAGRYLGGQPDWSSPRLTAQVRYVVEDVLGDAERRALHVASLLGAGTVQSLSECGLPDVNLRQLRRISRAMPLFRVSGRFDSGEAGFRCHAILAGHMRERLQRERRLLAGAEQSIVDNLVETHRLTQASEVAARILTDEAIYTLSTNTQRHCLSFMPWNRYVGCSSGCRLRG